MARIGKATNIYAACNNKVNNTNNNKQTKMKTTNNNNKIYLMRPSHWCARYLQVPVEKDFDDRVRGPAIEKVKLNGAQHHNKHDVSCGSQRQHTGILCVRERACQTNECI